MLHYLATPYSKYAGGLEAAFQEAARIAAELTRRTMLVYSPIAHSHPLAVHGGIDPLRYSIWLPMNVRMMDACDALLVATMDGWQESVGVSDEISAFDEMEKPVWLVNPASLLQTPYGRNRR